MRYCLTILALLAPPLAARDLDILTTALDVDIDVRNQRVSGRATLAAQPLVDTSTLTLDAVGLDVRKVTVNGEQAEFALANRQLQIRRPARATERLNLVIDYASTWRNQSDPNALSGSNGTGVRFFGPTHSEPRERWQAWTSHEPGSSKHWFPTIDAASERFDFKLTARVESPLQVLSVGKRESLREDAAGRREFVYVAQAPLHADRAGFVVGEYVAIDAARPGIQHFAYPDEVEATRASVERFDDMLAYFENLTGVTFPHSEYRQVFVQDTPWGMALPGLAIQTENMVDDARTHADYLYLWDSLEAESLAHQWFGNHLTVRDPRELWLMRGLARHIDGLYVEHKNGRAEWLLWNFNWENATVLGDWQNGVREALRPATPVDGFGAGNTPNLRGSLVLSLLRDQLGDAAWRRALQVFATANAGRAVRTEDLLDAIEDASGRRMDAFFEQWVYAIGQPDLRVEKRYDADARRLHIRIEQRQEALVAAAMDIEIDGRIERIMVPAEKAFDVAMAQANAPRFVNVDVEDTWIKTIEYPQDDAELMAQARSSTDVVAVRRACAELVKRAATNAALRSQVGPLLVEIASDATRYWRARYLAVLQLGALLGPEPIDFDAATERALLSIIERSSAWLRNGALLTLGRSRDPQHAPLYRRYLDDPSDRVRNAAAIALGQSGAPDAFESLVDFSKRESWKQQSVISALYAMAELKDPRGIEFALRWLQDADPQPRWTLATPVWDYRLSAARTLAALGAGDRGTPIVAARLRKALAAGDISDVFNQVLLLATLADPGAARHFVAVREKYANDAQALAALDAFEQQYRAAIVPP